MPIPKRPWKANFLMILDANGQQVLHLGGMRDQYGRALSGQHICELAAYIVTAANKLESDSVQEKQ